MPGDNVVSPSHYCVTLQTKFGPIQVECLDVIEALGLDEDLFLGSLFQYVWRAGKKWNKLEDLKKGRFYLDRAIKKLERTLDEVSF